MINKGILSPFIGMWCANFFLMALGVILYHYSSTEKTLRFDRIFDILENIKNRIRDVILKQLRQKKNHSIKYPAFLSKFHIFKILDLYVAQKLIFTFFLVSTSLLMVFYIITIMELIDDVVENKVAFSRIFEYVYYHTPEMISFVLPVSVLTAVLLTFSVMSKNNELVAVQVSGISLHRLTRPAILTGIFLSLIFFYVQENIMPDANKKKEEVLHIIRNIKHTTDEETTKNWAVGDQNEFYFYNLIDKQTDKIMNFNVIYVDKEFRLQKRFSAKAAHWIDDKELVLEKGFERIFEDNRPIYFKKFNSKQIHIDKGKEMFKQKIAFPQFMNINTLKKYIEYLRSKKANTHKYEAKLYYNYAYPLSSLIMVLIAIPFSFLMGNRGTFFGIGIAIGISMVFWFAFALFSALGAAAVLSPFISAFAPIFIFAGISIYLFINIKT